MTRILNRTIVGAVAPFAILPIGQLLGQQVQTRERYVYVLQVSPRFQEEASWAETENAVVTRHFDRLAQAAKAGQVILAGRTNEPLDKTFGFVIF